MLVYSCGSNRRTRFFACALAALAVLIVPSPAAAAPTPVVPIQSLLVKALEPGRNHVGDVVLAKVAVEWSSPQCRLRKGAVLKGRVVAETERSKTARTSELAVLFDSGECDGKGLVPLPLTVAAVLAPGPTRDDGLYEGEQTQPLSEAPGLAIGGGNVQAGPESGGSNLRSVMGAAATSFYQPPRPKHPRAVMPGQVIGFGAMKLSIGTGPEGSSMLSDVKHNIRLDASSQLVLVPRLNTVQPATPAAPAATPPASSASAPSSHPPAAAVSVETPAEEETDVCSPPSCNLSLLANEEDAKAAKAMAMVSVKELGYPGRPTREMFAFDEDAAIAYLGPKELLFTFNPHRLVPRTGADASADTTRMIHGVLINVTSMKAGKVVAWRVADSQRYLWAVGKDKVLIHAGNELRLYGPGLKLEQMLSLQGPLAFVRTSPSGTYFAVGVLQERHSPSIHRQLAEAEAREPEEDINIRVLDENFRPLVSVIRSSRDPAPVLSDGGEIRIPTIGKNRWRVVEYAWSGQRRVLAHLTSTCVPQATSLPPNLLFLTGCDRQASGKWYRVLAPSGNLVLKGWSPASAVQQTPRGSAGGDAFVFAIARTATALAPEGTFHASDLLNESIGVYGADNGRRLFGVSIPSPVPTEQTVALSPDGGQLAVLTEGQIAFYAVPVPSEAQNRQ